jgi:hypothetical protein
MANVPRFYDATVVAGVDTMAALLNSGHLRIYTGSQPALNGAVSGTLLADLTFGATAFAGSSASAGTVTATANSITADSSADATGTAGYFALVKSDGTTVVATGTVGTSGADLNLNSTAISAGAAVSVSSFTITQAQS